MKKKTSVLVFILAALWLSLMLALFASPFASSWPDGLEKVAEKLGFIDKASETGAWTKSPAPDYIIPGIGTERLATSLAGVAGTLAVFAAGWGMAFLLRKRNAKRPPSPELNEQSRS